MSQITERKRYELRAKYDSLEEDFEYWRGLTSKGLGLHTSQIEALIGKDRGALSNLCATLKSEVEGLDTMTSTQVLTDAWSLEEMLLAAHCLWGFFREKLAQRLDEEVRPFLEVADDLAWGCYAPAMKAANAKKEPPLVFLNGGWSPFMVPRGAQWNAEGVPGSLLVDGEFAGVMRSLPIPIIGVPYAQVTHLPDVIFVAHETGHAIEGDFDLTELLADAIKKALAGSSRLSDWLAWMGECFADAWAVANLGPAYVGALQDFLAPGHDKPGDSLYPPVTLRVRLARALLEKMDTDFGTDAVRLQTEWQQAGLNDSKHRHDEDLEKVVAALLDTEIKAFGGKTTKQLGGYGSSQHKESESATIKALNGEAIQGGDPRVLFSALRSCYEHTPATFNCPEVNPGKPTEVVRESLRARFLAKLKPTDTARSDRASAGPIKVDLYTRLKEILDRRSPEGSRSKAAGSL